MCVNVQKCVHTGDVCGVSAKVSQASFTEKMRLRAGSEWGLSGVAGPTVGAGGWRPGVQGAAGVSAAASLTALELGRAGTNTGHVLTHPQVTVRS